MVHQQCLHRHQEEDLLTINHPYTDTEAAMLIEDEAIPRRMPQMALSEDLIQRTTHHNHTQAEANLDHTLLLVPTIPGQQQLLLQPRPM